MARIPLRLTVEAEVDGVGIHHIHERGKGPNPTPPLLIHEIRHREHERPVERGIDELAHGGRRPFRAGVAAFLIGNPPGKLRSHAFGQRLSEQRVAGRCHPSMLYTKAFRVNPS